MKGVGGGRGQDWKILPLWFSFVIVETIVLEANLFLLSFLCGRIILDFFSVHAHILLIHTFYRKDIKDVILTFIILRGFLF